MTVPSLASGMLIGLSPINQCKQPPHLILILCPPLSSIYVIKKFIYVFFWLNAPFYYFTILCSLETPGSATLFLLLYKLSGLAAYCHYN